MTRVSSALALAIAMACLACSALTPTSTLSGVVVNEAGATVPGIRVTVVGSSLANVTDSAGRFSISVPRNAKAYTLSVESTVYARQLRSLVAGGAPIVFQLRQRGSVTTVTLPQQSDA